MSISTHLSNQRPTLPESIIVALIISLVGTIIYGTCKLLFGSILSFFFVVTTISFIYLLYLLWRSPRKEGRYTAFLIWCLITAITALTNISLLPYVLLQSGIIWLFRAYFYHHSFLTTAADGVLFLLGIATAIWTYINTQSPFLSLWTFFLLQALITVIPQKQSILDKPTHSTEQRFNRAKKSAENAIEKLLSTHP